MKMGEEEKVSLMKEEIKPEEEDEEDSEKEADYDGYFLEPTGDSVNIAEKIAGANKKLFEESEDENNEIRPRKVKFSEELVKYEPDYEEVESTEENTFVSEEVKLELISDEANEKNDEKKDEKTNFYRAENQVRTEIEIDRESDFDSKAENEIEETTEEIDKGIGAEEKKDAEFVTVEETSKLLLVLHPQEECSESIVAGPIHDISTDSNQNLDLNPEKVLPKPKIVRPKSANGSKNVRKTCEMPKISPTLNCSPNTARRCWQGSRPPVTASKSRVVGNEKKNAEAQPRSESAEKSLKKIVNIDPILNCEAERKDVAGLNQRPNSSYPIDRKKNDFFKESRPKTAPMKRNCCFDKSDLPRYNGLRSEYGLSAEQLQERKQRTLQINYQRKQAKLKEGQEKLRKKNQNEEIFQRWLLSKRKKDSCKKSVKPTDTLSRSDVYIQTHASYASNHNVPYSIDYSLGKKSNSKLDKKAKKSIVFEKAFDEISPHFKSSTFDIYLGARQ